MGRVVQSCNNCLKIQFHFHLQRNDIAMAISKYDQFDFLIDIVPRDEIKPAKKEEKTTTTVLGPEQVLLLIESV